MLYFPLLVLKESITTGNIFISPRVLKQMEGFIARFGSSRWMALDFAMKGMPCSTLHHVRVEPSDLLFVDWLVSTYPLPQNLVARRLG